MTEVPTYYPTIVPGLDMSYFLCCGR